MTQPEKQSDVSHQVIDMPGWRPIVRKIVTRVLIVSLVPMAVFYATLSLADVRTAALVTASLYYACLLTRVLRRQPVLPVALFAAGLLGMRTVIMFCTGNTFVYFLQPVAGTVATATAFAATALAGRPMIERLAHDFCPLTPELSAQLRSAKYFQWVSLVWAINYAVNAAATVWLLITASLDGFIMVKSILGPALTVTAGVVSYLVLLRTMRRRNVRVRFANHQGWSPAAA